MTLKLFDTHTHFDVPDFDPDREQLAYTAKAVGVDHLVLIGSVSYTHLTLPTICSV